MEKGKLHIGISDLILTVLSAVFLAGIRTVFTPCGSAEDGSWMTCHWAGQAVTGLAAVLFAISLIHLFIQKTEIKQGLSLAMIPAAVLTALLPGNLISLCMMNTMRCHSLMRPFVIVMGILYAVSGCVKLVLDRRREEVS